MSDDSHEYDEDALEFIEDERVRIAALHATCPKQIWLQIDPEAEQFDGWDAQTWCSDKINETDVRYVLAASRDAEVVSLTNQRDYEYVRAENAEQERDQLLIEVAAWRKLNEQADKTVDKAEQERDQLREQVKIARGYFEAIIDPIAYMRSKLENGQHLNGQMAIQLSEDHSYLKGLAKKALTATEQKP